MTSPLVWSLPPVPEAVGVARRRLRSHLTSVPEPRLDDVLLATSEVVTNAVRHGRGPVLVQVWPGPEVLRVEVADSGAAAPVQPREPGVEDEGGRGLCIVAAVATRWGVVPVEPGPGKVVWFEMEPATGQPAPY